ncbi:hypothetical protein [Tolypothrix sp. VBCCA 56010]|uniref:hypothetical protein n=1 Tax=Tolypothrix sp. VBCCA 56010 TaxID=3137731 RepID=UPI003D7C3F86
MAASYRRFLVYAIALLTGEERHRTQQQQKTPALNTEVMFEKSKCQLDTDTKIKKL